MPIFLFPRSAKHADRCVRILQLTPLDTISMRTKKEEDKQPSDHPGHTDYTAEASSTAQKTHVEEAVLQQSQMRISEEICVEPHPSTAAEPPDVENATEEELYTVSTHEVTPSAVHAEHRDSDPGNAPISAFLSSTPFHTQETLQSLKTDAPASEATTSPPGEHTEADTAHANGVQPLTEQPHPDVHTESPEPPKEKNIAEVKENTASISTGTTKTKGAEKPTEQACASKPQICDEAEEAIGTESDSDFSHSSDFFSRTVNNQKKNQVAETLFEIPIEQIHPNPQQPRKHFSAEALRDLAESIRQYGILQPLLVRKSTKHPHGEGAFELIAGERRLHAARISGLYSVPCIVMHVTTEDSASIALIENLQRKNLDHFEQAQAIQTLIQRYQYTQEQIATRLGCSQSYIANKLRILRLSPEEQAKILQNNLTERHARALLQITHTAIRTSILYQIIKNQWTVAETEHQISAVIKSKNGTDTPSIPQKPLPERRCLHTIERAMYKFKQNGGDVSCEKRENSELIEWIIRFAKK